MHASLPFLDTKVQPRTVLERIARRAANRMYAETYCENIGCSWCYKNALTSYTKRDTDA
jgi:hypothetical protein